MAVSRDSLISLAHTVYILIVHRVNHVNQSSSPIDPDPISYQVLSVHQVSGACEVAREMPGFVVDSGVAGVAWATESC